MRKLGTSSEIQTGIQTGHSSKRVNLFRRNKKINKEIRLEHAILKWREETKDGRTRIDDGASHTAGDDIALIVD